MAGLITSQSNDRVMRRGKRPLKIAQKLFGIVILQARYDRNTMMNKPISIKVPAFADDQLTGGRRMVHSLISFIFGGRGNITIQNGILSYKESRIASSPSKSIDLNKISKLLVVRTDYSSAKNSVD